MSFMNEWSSQGAAESQGFSVIPEGTYKGVVDNCTLDLTKSPNRLTIIYKLTSEEVFGRKLFANYNLAGQAVGFLKKDLKTLGLDYSLVQSPEDLVELVWSATNKSVELYVKHREYNGKTYESVFLNGQSLGKPISKQAPQKPKVQKPVSDDDFSFA